MTEVFTGCKILLALVKNFPLETFCKRSRAQGGVLRLAHKTGGGSTRKNKDSISKRLGVKIYGGQKVTPGNIIVRQKGNKFYSGLGTKQGNDYTIFAISSGKVDFKKKLNKTFVQVS